MQPSVDGSIKKDDGQAKPSLRPVEGPSQLGKEETGIARKKIDVSSSKIIHVQEKPHRPTNFFER